MATDISDRLQPALLDRLTDEHLAGEDFRVMSKAQLRKAVLRDLSVLFNTVQPGAGTLLGDPVLAASVLNFGLPSLAGGLASRMDIAKLEEDIATAIRRFEPRIRPDTLVVRAVQPSHIMDTHNVIEFQIRGELWSQPLPQDILLRTQMNLEAGQVELSDATQVVSPAMLRKTTRN